MVECEKLQSIFCCWQYKATNIKLKSLGLVTLNAKEFSAGFHCALKDADKLRNLLHLSRHESQHITVCYMNKKIPQKFKLNTHTPLHRLCTCLNFVIPTHFWTDFISFNLNTAKKNN